MSLPAAPFIHALRIRPRRLGEQERDYTDDMPALQELGRLDLHPEVTFLVGENGSGKYQFSFTTRASHSSLHARLELERAPIAPLNGFFLRAESVFNLATQVEDTQHDVFQRKLHEQSHGESFLDIAVNRLGPRGL